MSMFKFMEGFFLFPFRLLLKIMMLFAPFFLVVLVAMAVIRYPYCTVSCLLGFLVSPIILRRVGIFSFIGNTGIDELLFCRSEIETLKGIKDKELDLLSDRYKQEEKSVTQEIQMIKEDKLRLGDWYMLMLQRKPDKIIVVDPGSVPVMDRIRYNLFHWRR